MKKLVIIIPCCNEEETLPQTNRRLLELLDGLVGAGKVREDSCRCYVDDGSRDRTWSLIAQYAEESRQVSGIWLSRNFGHQNALLAGLFTVDGDYFITVDAGLQSRYIIAQQCGGRKNNSNYVTCCYCLIFIGDFVFHTFWEAKCQYTLPYFMLLLPMTVSGDRDLCCYVQQRKHHDRSWRQIGS